MAAIITEKFRLNNAKSFVEEVGENNPYTFIGRGHAWADDSSPPTPVDSPNDEFDAYRNMVALKQISASDATHAIVRRDWTDGTQYDEYRHNYSSGNTAATGATTLWDSLFYVVTEDYNVYKCIANGTADQTAAERAHNVSTEKPDHTTLATPTEADDYQWKYMYSISASDVIKFVTNDFIPVKTLGAKQAVDGSLADGGLNATGSNDGSAQWDVENGAVDGALDRVRIRSVGSGLTNGTYTTKTVYGDGTGGRCTVTVDGNEVVNAVITTAGTGYTYAYLLASDVSGPVNQPADGTSTSPNIEFIIGPKHGHGADAVEELGGNYVILNSRLEYAEGAGDFPTDNDFRQIGVIFNPTNYGADTLFTDATGKAYKTMELVSTAFSAPTVDTIIRNANPEIASTAVGVVISVDSTTRIISYLPYPNEAGNITDFGNNQAIFSASSTAHGTTKTSAAIVNEDIKRHSGDIIYLENRGAVSRASDQIEDIKLIVEM